MPKISKPQTLASRRQAPATPSVASLNTHPALALLHEEIRECTACPRLRKYCLEVAKTKRRSFAQDIYWGKPVTGFGDPRARLLIVGLAPAAHGANRTGRIFTGDRSGDWLYRAMHKAGFANQPTSVNADDGLELHDAYVSCVARCAPPDNKPEPQELERCSDFLRRELVLMPQTRVYLVLGNIALAGLWRLLNEDETRSTASPTTANAKSAVKRKPPARPKFGHGAEVALPNGRGTLLMSYHPSQQNTFTGRLTEPMFDSVFTRARELLEGR